MWQNNPEKSCNRFPKPTLTLTPISFELPFFGFSFSLSLTEVSLDSRYYSKTFRVWKGWKTLKIGTSFWKIIPVKFVKSSVKNVEQKGSLPARSCCTSYCWPSSVTYMPVSAKFTTFCICSDATPGFSIRLKDSAIWIRLELKWTCDSGTYILNCCTQIMLIRGIILFLSSCNPSKKWCLFSHAFDTGWGPTQKQHLEQIPGWLMNLNCENL